MSDNDHALAEHLMQLAICNTDHPAAAATALMTAAGIVLHARFGAAGALNLMRAGIDDAAAALTAQHGRQPGEVVQ